MRLLPASLFSRMVLVLLGVLVAAQLVSFAIHMHERGEVLSQASGMQAAQRIADLVALLDPLPGAERQRVARIVSAPPLTVTFGQPPLQAKDGEEGARAAIFGTMLRRFLGEGREARVVFRTQPAEEVRGPPRMQPGAHMHRMAGMGPNFIAQVRLKDGTLATFDSRLPQQAADWPYRLLLSLAVLLIAVVAVSLLAVRWATRPLAALADAADELGRDIDRPPMPEDGPREVVRAARAFNTMQTRLGRHVRERTAMLAAMSHDLKTPLTRLRLRAELLEDGQLKDKISRDLAEMEALVHASLSFMRGIDAAERTQPIDVTALLESVCADATEAGAKVTLDGSAKAPYAGRPQALKRCLGNLLDNALKYAGAAEISVEDDARQLRVRICDRGPGIPEGELERVFEPFYRVEASRNRDTGGTGLGLSIARDIAQLHGGTLALANRTGGGVEAVLTLPRGAGTGLSG